MSGEVEVRVYLKTDSVPEAIQHVVFALIEAWGATDAANMITAINAVPYVEG